MADTQRSLFTPDAYGSASLPHSRASDPETSRVAERQHRATGKLGRHAEIVMDLLRKRPGSTYAELFAFASADVQKELGDNKEVARRLPDLVRDGLAETRIGPDGREAARTCSIKGSRMRVWYPTEQISP